MTEEQAQSEEWLTLAEAAERLGVSIDTVRRRLHRGELASKQELTRFGKAWFVRLKAVPSAPNGLHSPVLGAGHKVPTAEQHEAPSPGNDVSNAEQGPRRPVGDGGILELVQLVKDLQIKAEAAAMWQARAMVLEEQLGFVQLQLMQAHEMIKALEAPKIPEADIRAEPPTPDLPWWRAWWHRLSSS